MMFDIIYYKIEKVNIRIKKKYINGVRS